MKVYGGSGGVLPRVHNLDEMNIHGQLPASAALPPGGRLLLPIELEGEWAAQLVLTL